MGHRNFFSRAEREANMHKLAGPDRLVRSYKSTGVSFTAESRREDWFPVPFGLGETFDLASFLSQLEEQGFADFNSGELFVSWRRVYQIKSSRDYGTSYPLLMLPPTSPLRPCLASHGSFSDADFSIFISGWVASDGAPVRENPRITGAIIATDQQVALLDCEVWKTLTAVAAFHERKIQNRTADSNRMCWAEIRRHAKAAKAQLSHFLESTVVVAPDKLTVELRKSEIAGGKVIEVLPNFPGQPPGWLQTFDRFGQVRDRYEVAHGEGLTHVVITPEVQTVLKEVKRMPARRVAGERAEAFVRNPFATLGPDADKVIDAAQFEEARAKAGISFVRFTARVEHDRLDSRVSVGLVVEEGDEGSSAVLPFADPDELEKFLAKVEARMGREAQCCPWQGYELEILGDTSDQVAILRAALHEWRAQGRYRAAEILDLSLYSDRVEGFGQEKPYFSPFIAREREGDGWFPDNVIFGLQYTPDGSEKPIALSLSEEAFQQFKQALQRAKDEHRTEFVLAGFPQPVTVAQAEVMLTIFQEAQRDVAAHKFNPEKESVRVAPKRNGLVVKSNVAKVDYAELRGSLSLPPRTKPLLPTTLRRDVSLKDHQLKGVAWLQHLWSLSPGACRGALLADDMGLGKTIQLLTFIAYCLERDPGIDPFLIVAPVSLLENWKEEIDKFFEPGTLPVLTLYGSALREKRLPRKAIEDELVHAGIARLLVRDWLGSAKVVLTTYETLRDLEFSLARQKWSVMVCDEAQKIKTPNAMVSRSAKKQNARFKIASTGTPVENTLTDLWCLFDYIQPGLLGSLKDFGDRYRRPIEAETEAEKARVGELRALIEPQKLRRTKAEVAKDLPFKIVDAGCRALPISARQRADYGRAVAQFKHGDGARTALKNHLGLLLYLRTVCSDPRPPGPSSLNLQPLAELEQYSPKMRWMLTQLARIKRRDEKAIVFCEFKELQRTIQRAIAERLGFVAEIINGDTSAAAETNNRQKRLRGFQQTAGFGVIILSPLAVGFGVNIQAANHVIHFTRTWNPAREDQATDRAYRIGQTKDVFVYYPVVVAQDFVTFDEKLDQLLEIKRKLSQDMLNGCGDVGPSDFADLQDVGGSTVFDTLPESRGLEAVSGR
jgi:SNF2-related domain/Helicase conserved C-terminal domain